MEHKYHRKVVGELAFCERRIIFYTRTIFLGLQWNFRLWINGGEKKRAIRSTTLFGLSRIKRRGSVAKERVGDNRGAAIALTLPPTEGADGTKERGEARGLSCRNSAEPDVIVEVVVVVKSSQVESRNGEGVRKYCVKVGDPRADPQPCAYRFSPLQLVLFLCLCLARSLPRAPASRRRTLTNLNATCFKLCRNDLRTRRVVVVVVAVAAIPRFDLYLFFSSFHLYSILLSDFRNSRSNSNANDQLQEPIDQFSIYFIIVNYPSSLTLLITICIDF